MSVKHVLLTGATGFIGSHVLPILVSKGYTITALTRNSSSYSKNSKQVNYVSIDLLNSNKCDELISELKPTHLMHLAWEARPGIYWTSKDNLKWESAGVALFKSFYENDGIRGISSGSCAQYEWGGTTPLIEGVSPDRPATLYGQSKLSFERSIFEHAKQSSYSYASGRIFMTYGPGEYPQKISASIISALMNNSSINTTDGMVMRDFMYVKDIAEALVALLESDCQGIVNIASGENVLLKDFIKKFAMFLDKPNLVNLGAIPRPSGEPEVLLADVTRLQNHVKFKPSYNLDSGIKEYVEFAASYQV